MEQIIFICTGNTCRSPMAEGLFRAHNGEEKTGLTAASAGLYTENGLPASANAVAAAGERGADISAHRSRQLTAEVAENAKYLVCMTGLALRPAVRAVPGLRGQDFHAAARGHFRPVRR